MEKRVVAAALGGLIVGIAGASLFMHAHAAPANMVCITDDPVADAKADAIMKQLHAHDHDKYVPQHIYPIGVLPKAAPPAPAKNPAQ